MECPTEVQPFCPDGETGCPEISGDGCPSWDCDACDEKPPICMPTPQFCPDGETFCPSKKDEQGCTFYDCNDCDVCPQIPTNQWCSDGETPCPKKEDENGCTVWDCSSCEEIECHPIPITRTCGDDYCEGKPLSECLCPMKKDENGCTVWDCDACDVCGPNPPLEFCPDCGEHLTNEERWTKCICPSKKDEQGCTYYDCDDCETIPDNCRKIILENGMEVIECEKDCLDIPEPVIKRCEESGGRVIKRNDHYGCPFMECEYDVEPGECPTPEELEARKESCLNQGLEPMIVRKEGCNTIKCRRAEPDQRCDEDVDVKKEIKEKCMETGGEIVKNFDDRGCPVTVCIYPGEECHKDVPSEAYQNCEMEEGDLMVKRDLQGCIKFIDCVKRGKKDIEYEEIGEMPSAATLLAVALKLESLKIDFEKLAKEVRAIAEYYGSTGNEEEAARFRKVAGLFSSALDRLDDIKIKFRENAREMTEEDLRELKHDMKYVSEVIMQDALYIILGGEIDVRDGTGETEGGYTDCGSDTRCWEEAVRLCEPAVHTPSKPIEGMIAKVHGLDDGGFCIIEAEAEGHSMVCKLLNYGTSMSGREADILEFCEGSLVGWITSGQKPGEIEKPKRPGKCADMCGDNICQREVCMAKGCPCSESPESCPRDCGGATPTEFDLCTEKDEEAWKICQNEGGLPQTDPSRYGNCEIYTHCRISYGTVEDCEKYTDIAIKNDCYIIIADNTGDSSVCVKVTEPDRRDKCYVKAATTSGDRIICEKIEDEGIKNHCYNCIAEDHYGGRIIKGSTGDVGEVVFTDDFEEGIENWVFHGEGSRSTVVENGNTVLKLYGVVQPDLPMEWDNYIFKFRFKRVDGSVHVNFRKSNTRAGQSRYIVAISENVDNLVKHFGEDWSKLRQIGFRFDEGWHTLEIKGYDNTVNVYIDDKFLAQYEDNENPFLSGMPGFEIHTGGRPITPEFLIDDVEIRISGEKDIVGGVS